MASRSPPAPACRLRAERLGDALGERMRPDGPLGGLLHRFQRRGEVETFETEARTKMVRQQVRERRQLGDVVLAHAEEHPQVVVIGQCGADLLEERGAVVASGEMAGEELFELIEDQEERPRRGIRLVRRAARQQPGHDLFERDVDGNGGLGRGRERGGDAVDEDVGGLQLRVAFADAGDADAADQPLRHFLVANDPAMAKQARRQSCHEQRRFPGARLREQQRRAPRDHQAGEDLDLLGSAEEEAFLLLSERPWADVRVVLSHAPVPH